MSETIKPRRWGDRYDGRRIRSADPINVVIPFIMPRRTGASNMYYNSLSLNEAEKYIRQKRVEGLKGFGVLTFFLAVYTRVLSQRPGLNRFIAGHRLFARRHIDFCLAVKKEMSVDAQETTIKIRCQPTDTAADVHARLMAAIGEAKATGDSNTTDQYARLLAKIPRVFLKFTISLFKFLDYFGKLPKTLNWVSPFHASLFIADLGSLGLPPVHHHLYDFGNCSMFIIFGAKYKKTEPDAQGNPVTRKMMDYTLTLDERVCDGFYFSGSFKFFNDIFQNPFQLDQPPARVIEDID